MARPLTTRQARQQFRLAAERFQRNLEGAVAADPLESLLLAFAAGVFVGACPRLAGDVALDLGRMVLRER